jgi:hypothetical protein
VVSLVSLVLSILALAPPHRQVQGRNRLADVVMWLWSVSIKPLVVAHRELWSDADQAQ